MIHIILLLFTIVIGAFGIIYYIFVNKPNNDNNDNVNINNNNNNNINNKNKHKKKVDITAQFNKNKKKNKNKSSTNIDHPLLYAVLKGHSDNISCVTASDNVIITGSEDRTIRIWNVSSLSDKEIQYTRINVKIDYPTELAISSNNKYLIAAMEDKKELQFYGINSHNNKITTAIGHTISCNYKSPINNICIRGAKCEQVLTTASENDTNINIFTGKGELIHQFDSHTLQNYDLKLSPNGGQFFALGSKLAEVKIFEIVTDKKTGKLSIEFAMALKGHKKGIVSLSFSSDNKHMVTACQDGSFSLWDIDVNYTMKEEPKMIKNIQTKFKMINAIECYNDIVVIASDKTIQFYNIKSGKIVDSILEAHHTPINRLVVIPNNDLIISSSFQDKHARVWRIPS